MKFFIATGRILFFLSLIITLACAQTPVQKDNHSIAIILKVTGDGGKISAVTLYNYNVFNARIKSDFEKFSGENSLHIIIKNEIDSTVYDNFLENPLIKNTESYSEKGVIEKVVSPNTADYVNLRFKIPESTKQLNIFCFFVKSESEEKEISKFNLKLK